MSFLDQAIKSERFDRGTPPRHTISRALSLVRTLFKFLQPQKSDFPSKPLLLRLCQKSS
jgi:hypothetical protein